jgi:hypothetical protein
MSRNKKKKTENMTKRCVGPGQKVEQDTEQFKRKNQCFGETGGSDTGRFCLPKIEEERNSRWKQNSNFLSKNTFNSSEDPDETIKLN